MDCTGGQDLEGEPGLANALHKGLGLVGIRAPDVVEVALFEPLLAVLRAARRGIDGPMVGLHVVVDRDPLLLTGHGNRQGVAADPGREALALHGVHGLGDRIEPASAQELVPDIALDVDGIGTGVDEPPRLVPELLVGHGSLDGRVNLRDHLELAAVLLVVLAGGGQVGGVEQDRVDAVRLGEGHRLEDLLLGVVGLE